MAATVATVATACHSPYREEVILFFLLALYMNRGNLWQLWQAPIFYLQTMTRTKDDPCGNGNNSHLLPPSAPNQVQ